MKLFGPQREILLLTFFIETWVTLSVVAGLDRCPNRPTSHGEKWTGREAVSEVPHWNKSHAKDTTSHQQPILQSFVQLWLSLASHRHRSSGEGAIFTVGNPAPWEIICLLTIEIALHGLVRDFARGTIQAPFKGSTPRTRIRAEWRSLQAHDSSLSTPPRRPARSRPLGIMHIP